MGEKWIGGQIFASFTHNRYTRLFDVHLCLILAAQSLCKFVIKLQSIQSDKKKLKISYIVQALA